MLNIKLKFTCWHVLLICAVFSCSKETEIITPVTDDTNILFIIADDLGKDAINGFVEGSMKPNTPNIDALRNDGLLFSNFWVNPTCTPTRATILTGKYGFRTNVKGVGDALSQSEVALQQYISDNTNDKYATAVVGKWHLAGNNSNVNPETFGIDYYAGLIRGAVDDYYQWQLTEDGVTSGQSGYSTEVFTDLSIDWMNNQDKPWFLWLAYNAPHTPFHVPPSNMHSQGSLPAYTNSVEPLPYYLAAIEAMDFQIGRLLENIPSEQRANTVVIFIGDNGTPNQVAQDPYSSAKVKNTLYQGGINTPMFISGKGVSRSGTVDNLTTGTDLFATIAAIAGVNVTEINDSKSFNTLLSQTATIRSFQYSEMNNGTVDSWTIRNESYKLIVDGNGNEEMYHLISDPYELSNLLNGTLTSAENAAKTTLQAELNRIRQ